MIAKTPVRPPLLSSQIARSNIPVDPNSIPAEIGATFAALDKLAGIWDALDAVRTHGDPLKTREARALEYKGAFERATSTATATVRAAAESLMTAKQRARHDAFGRAGLLAKFENTADIRAVLRGMDQATRDAVLTQAIERGDFEIMNALHGAHPILIGETTIPVNVLIDSFVEARAPEEAARISAISDALEHLEMAHRQFNTSAEKMRDPQAEADGIAGAKAAREAEAKLGLALSELQPSSAA